jgi:hypothetical protein
MRRLRYIPALALALAFVWSAPALADGTFTVSGVHVDASASSVVEARNAAMASGRPAAWQTLFRRLTRQQDWSRQPALDSPSLERLILSYYPTNERRSTTRYVADMTYIFNPDAVARLLQSANIPYAAAPAKRILVVPMSPTYVRNSGWTAALASPRFTQNSVVPFAVPVGDATDQSALNGLVFDTASWNDVSAAAARVHASEAVLILAVPAGNKLAVTLKRLGPGELPVKTGFELPILQGAQSTYPAAADAAVHALEDMWKSHAAVDFSQKGTLEAEVYIASLPQLATLQSTLAAVPNVQGVIVVAMNTGEARLAISYIGTQDQLREALTGAGLALASRGGTWVLAQGTPVAP